MLELGADITEIALGFLASAEFNADYTGNTAFVQNLYEDVLGRNADSAGLTSWLAQLQQRTSRETVVEGFLFSTEADEVGVNGFYQGFLPTRAAVFV